MILARPIYGNNQQNGSNYLYTKGKEFSLNGISYRGCYHIYKSALFTEGEHTTNSRRLQPYYNNQIEYEYDINTNSDFKPIYQAPRPYRVVVKEISYQSGFIFRYFVQKVVQQDAIVYEISESDSADLGKVNSVDMGLYQGVIVRWKLTGPLRSQIVNNKLPSGVVIQSHIEGIVDHNQAQVLLANTILPGLASSIVNYSQFARPSNFNPEFEVNTEDITLSKLLRDTVPFSVKKVFIKAIRKS